MQFPRRRKENAQQVDPFYVQPQKTGDSTQYARDSIRSVYNAYDTHAKAIKRRNIFRAGVEKHNYDKFVEKMESNTKDAIMTKARQALADFGSDCTEGHDCHDVSTQPEGGCGQCTTLNGLHHYAGLHETSDPRGVQYPASFNPFKGPQPATCDLCRNGM